MLLRVVGAGCLLAIVGVLMPVDWMDAAHEHLLEQPLPRGPVVDYLARSVSVLYMVVGGLMILVSFNPTRYRAIVLYLAYVFLVLGAAVLVIDLINALPWWWTYPEGLGTLAVGVLLLILQRNVARAPQGGGADDD